TIAIAMRSEVSRHILAEQRDGCGVGTVADGQGAAEVVAGLGEAERGARAEGDVAQVDRARHAEARDRAAEVHRVTELQGAAAGREVDLAGTRGTARLDLQNAAAEGGTAD